MSIKDIKKKRQNHLLVIFNDYLKSKTSHELKKTEDEIVKHLESLRIDTRGISVLEEISAQLRVLFEEVVNPTYKLACLINFLIEITENEPKKITVFYKYLRNALSNYKPSDIKALTEITNALGRLAKDSTTLKTLTAEWVHYECKRALEWLEGKDKRILASVYVLRELAQNSPTFFYPHVGRFLQLIWIGLRDHSEKIRTSSVAALIPVLILVSERQSPDRICWYHDLLKEVKNGFKKKNLEFIHSSLLVTAALLEHTGENFMKGYDDLICKNVLKFFSSRDKLIKRCVIQILPTLSKFYGDKFNEKYLKICLAGLFKIFKSNYNRDVAFITLGKVMLNAKEVIKKNKALRKKTIDVIKEALISKKRPFIEESLTCLALFAETVTDSIKDEINELIRRNLLFANGLSEALVDCLNSLTQSIPSVLKIVQIKLLDTISIILSKVPFSPINMLDKYIIPPVYEDVSNRSITLALKTLSGFNLKGHNLTDFVSDHLVVYLSHENEKIRKEAAKTCCTLLVSKNKTSYSDEIDKAQGYFIGEVLQKLLTVAIVDPDENIRLTVLKNLDERYDEYLCLTDNLGLLFISSHDEMFPIREMSIKIIGRLSEKNPSFVLSSLRRTLLQLLTKLEHAVDFRSKEESAKMLGHLIEASPQLIRPYVTNIYRVLYKNVLSPNISVSKQVLDCLGKLSMNSGGLITKFLDQILPAICKTLQDQSSSQKREIAVRTLGQLVKSTGCVISPYEQHPNLLSILLNILKTDENWSARNEVIKVLGIIGAVDPYTRMILENNATGDAIETGLQTTKTEDDIMSDLTPSSEEYCPQVAFIALMRILRDPTLKTYHSDVIQAVMYIFRSLGMRCVPYLDQIMTPFLELVRRTSQVNIKINLFRQLCLLVGTVGHHIRKYIGEIFDLIKINWDTDAKIQIMELEVVISQNMNEEFSKYLPIVIPPIIVLLQKKGREHKFTRKALSAIKEFAKYLTNYLYLVVPAVVGIYEDSYNPVSLIRNAVYAIESLAIHLDTFEYSSRIIHPLARLFLNNNPELHKIVLNVLCTLIVQMNIKYVLFIPLVNRYIKQIKNVSDIKASLQKYDDLVSKLRPMKYVYEFDVRASRLYEEKKVKKEITKIQVNVNNLKRTWEAKHRSAKEDWLEWSRGLSVELLKESPSPSLRSCASLAQMYHPLAKELFNSGFLSCWCELEQKDRDEIVRAIEIAFSSPNLPSEVLQTLLNVAEFMEHDEKPLPIAISSLGFIAKKCQCYAKALHYKEMEFQENPALHVDELISINNKLNQHDAAIGILRFAQKHPEIEFKDFWYEKLHRWNEALEQYQKREKTKKKNSFDNTLGIMRCLRELGEWEQLVTLSEKIWNSASESLKERMAVISSHCAWMVGNWDFMKKSVGYLKDDSQGCFFRAVIHVHQRDFEVAKRLIEKSRYLLDRDVSTLVSESYSRAYDRIVTLQQLVELEEVIEFLSEPEKQPLIKKIWNDRLQGVSNSVKQWRKILSVRQLVLRQDELMDDYITLAWLARENRKFSISSRIYDQLLIPKVDLQSNPENVLKTIKVQPGGFVAMKYPAKLYFNFFKHLWDIGMKVKAVDLLTTFVNKCEHDLPANILADASISLGKWNKEIYFGVNINHKLKARQTEKIRARKDEEEISVNVKPEEESEDSGEEEYSNNSNTGSVDLEEKLQLTLKHFTLATKYDPKGYLGWHYWAVFYSQIATYLERSLPGNEEAETDEEITVIKKTDPELDDPELALKIEKCLCSAIFGFFKSIELSPGGKITKNTLQDLLRLLTLWFRHGTLESVNKELMKGFNQVNVDFWLNVIPQVIARINTNILPLRNLVGKLLMKIGKKHPQALVYPLAVCTKSDNLTRKAESWKLMENLKHLHHNLISEALLVSDELIRIAILWAEEWNVGLDEASRLYFGHHNVEEMFRVLIPLHQKIDHPTTLSEITFVQTFGRDLKEAFKWCMKYKSSGRDSDLSQAWDLYYSVFRRISKQLQHLYRLELKYISPKLQKVKNLKLHIPGTYLCEYQNASLLSSGTGEIDTEKIENNRIGSFVERLELISSKQRPRKLLIQNMTGKLFLFLLKGHEDSRQDERVMQLFGLVNTLLRTNQETRKKYLCIKRYSITPLSSNCGCSGWVSNCDTLHKLIKDYRESRSILLNLEHRFMIQMAPLYDHLSLMQKIEVFEYALNNTTGQDLHKILWLKSKSSEAWLNKRTNFSRSLAVMSIVGYILGLGDRHPSNLMLEKHTGKIVHIDFGDCFEVAMQREKFPEKIPFRLTRMLVTAMEVCGIEGTFRATSIRVLKVLRQNKNSLMAMLEAFVYDPLINWRLINNKEKSMRNNNIDEDDEKEKDMDTSSLSQVLFKENKQGNNKTELIQIEEPNSRSYREKTLKRFLNQNEKLQNIESRVNKKALKIIKRIENKLQGSEMNENVTLKVEDQVDVLIQMATDHSNLAQCYIGWCAFW